MVSIGKRAKSIFFFTLYNCWCTPRQDPVYVNVQKIENDFEAMSALLPQSYYNATNFTQGIKISILLWTIHFFVAQYSVCCLPKIRDFAFKYLTREHLNHTKTVSLSRVKKELAKIKTASFFYTILVLLFLSSISFKLRS